MHDYLSNHNPPHPQLKVLDPPLFTIVSNSGLLLFYRVKNPHCGVPVIVAKLRLLEFYLIKVQRSTR